MSLSKSLLEKNINNRNLYFTFQNIFPHLVMYSQDDKLNMHIYFLLSSNAKRIFFFIRTRKWEKEKQQLCKLKSTWTSDKRFGRHEKANPKPAVNKNKEKIQFLKLENPLTAPQLTAPGSHEVRKGYNYNKAFQKQFNHQVPLTNFMYLGHCHS